METKTSLHRSFRHPITLETTRLRYLEHKGIVSRPERAGQDVGAHAFITNGSKAECRQAWRQAQDALLAEGFVVVKTERVSVR